MAASSSQPWQLPDAILLVLVNALSKKPEEGTEEWLARSGLALGPSCHASWAVQCGIHLHDRTDKFSGIHLAVAVVTGTLPNQDLADGTFMGPVKSVVDEQGQPFQQRFAQAFNLSGPFTVPELPPTGGTGGWPLSLNSFLGAVQSDIRDKVVEAFDRATQLQVARLKAARTPADTNASELHNQRRRWEKLRAMAIALRTSFEAGLRERSTTTISVTWQRPQDLHENDVCRQTNVGVWVGVRCEPESGVFQVRSRTSLPQDSWVACLAHSLKCRLLHSLLESSVSTRSRLLRGNVADKFPTVFWVSCSAAESGQEEPESELTWKHCLAWLVTLEALRELRDTTRCKHRPNLGSGVAPLLEVGTTLFGREGPHDL